MADTTDKSGKERARGPTGFLRYGADLEVLLVTKGHPFERDAFFDIFEAWRGISCSAVEQPAAQAFFTPEAAAPYDALVLYDMPGIEFRPGSAPVLHAPPAAFVKGFHELLEAGKGFVNFDDLMRAAKRWNLCASDLFFPLLLVPLPSRPQHAQAVS